MGAAESTKDHQLVQALRRIADLEHQVAALRPDQSGSRKENWIDRCRMVEIAISHAQDFTYIFNLEGRFVYVNRALLELWQKPLEEALGKNFHELGYPPDLAQRLQWQIEEVIRTKAPLRDQTLYTGPSGDTRHYEYIFVPVFDPDGSIEAVTGSTRDTTERHSAEEALRKSEERLQFALAAGGGVGTWDWAVQTDRVFANPEFAKLFSIDPERAEAGVPVADFVLSMHPEDRARVKESIQRALVTGTDFAEEYRLVQTNGPVQWVLARGRCDRDTDGAPSRFPGVVFNITSRKVAEERLRESQERLRAIYDGTYEYIGLLAPDGRVLETNRASLEFAGNGREDVVGKLFWDTPWFDATPGAPEAVREAVASAATGQFVRFESTLRRPSGDTPTFDLSFHPIRNALGEVVLIVPEGRDISDRKAAERELQHSNEDLRRVNRELEEFAYVASHDLQEPLRMVNIYTQLILKRLGGADEELTEFAGFVRNGITRMEALIGDLLTFSKTVQRVDSTAGIADLNQSLAVALSRCRLPIEESGALITFADLPRLTGDTGQITHVFQNILSNALKYRKPDVVPEIDVSAELRGSEWTIAVADNGIGFEQQYAEGIFGLFKRLHKEQYPGTGMGLAICQRIVERYGGHMRAEGRPGEGSTFYFTLPVPATGV